MNLDTVAEKLNLKNLTPEIGRNDSVPVSFGYVTDLLSDVLSNAPRGGILITVQAHMNVIAVASHAELSAVIFALGRMPDESVRAKAIEEKIPLFVSRETAFEIVGRLYSIGLRGHDA